MCTPFPINVPISCCVTYGCTPSVLTARQSLPSALPRAACRRTESIQPLPLAVHPSSPPPRPHSHEERHRVVARAGHVWVAQGGKRDGAAPAHAPGRDAHLPACPADRSAKRHRGSSQADATRESRPHTGTSHRGLTRRVGGFAREPCGSMAAGHGRWRARGSGCARRSTGNAQHRGGLAQSEQ